MPPTTDENAMRRADWLGEVYQIALANALLLGAAADTAERAASHLVRNLAALK